MAIEEYGQVLVNQVCHCCIRSNCQFILIIF